MARKPLVWRVLSRVEIGEPEKCWRWLGRHDRRGYGRSVSHPRVAHRAVYVILRGALADDRLVIDHLCRNPGCVNPHHLEAVTQRTNVLRGTSPASRAAINPVCPRGHPKDGWRNGGGKRFRYCKTCNRENAVRQRQKNRRVS